MNKTPHRGGGALILVKGILLFLLQLIGLLFAFCCRILGFLLSKAGQAIDHALNKEH